MYWHIGERINRELLDNKRAEYGKQIVAQVARQLQEELRPDVVVSAMARSPRDGARRGAAPRPVALHRRRRRADRAAATRQVGYQSGAVHDRTALQRVAATPVAQRHGSRTAALGELYGGLTAKDYFAKQEKICNVANEITT